MYLKLYIIDMMKRMIKVINFTFSFIKVAQSVLALLYFSYFNRRKKRINRFKPRIKLTDVGETGH